MKHSAIKASCIALSFGVALLVPATALADTPVTTEQSAESATQSTNEPTPTVKKRPAKWKSSKGYVYCKLGNGKKAKGLVKIKGKTYFFDKKGRQRTGWRKVSGNYRFFTIANGAKGSMVKSKTINGVKLDSEGIAKLTTNSKLELEIMAKANKRLDAIAKPGESKAAKLKKVWNWLKKSCTEHGVRANNRGTKGWHRAYARDIIFNKGGDCDSFAAGFTYLANAVGMKSCKIVSTGGHGWSEINGRVYDPEYSRGTAEVYNRSYSNPGVPVPYRSGRSFATIVTISKRTKSWGGKTIKTQTKKVKNGWSNEKLFLNGKLVSGPARYKSKLYWLKKSGKINSKKTSALRKAAKANRPAAPLLAMLGAPKKTVEAKSCMAYKGQILDDAIDTIYTYNHLKVSTYKASGVAEFVLSVS